MVCTDVALPCKKVQYCTAVALTAIQIDVRCTGSPDILQEYDHEIDLLLEPATKFECTGAGTIVGKKVAAAICTLTVVEYCSTVVD